MVGVKQPHPSSSSSSSSSVFSSRRSFALLMSSGPASSSASSYREATRSMLPWLEASKESLKGSHRWRRATICRNGCHTLKKRKALCCRPTTFNGNGGQFWTPHNLLSILVPSFLSFVVEKIGTFSSANEISNLDLSQTRAYFEVTISNPYSWWKKISNDIYILPMFGVLYKKLHFLRQTVEFASLSLHRFACKANWDSKSGSETTP